VRSAFPWLRHVFADSAYAGDKLKGALENLRTWTVEIIKRSDVAKGFVLLGSPPPAGAMRGVPQMTQAGHPPRQTRASRHIHCVDTQVACVGKWAISDCLWPLASR
jgi:hypothetical protein